MEDIDGGLQPAVDGQSLGEDEDDEDYNEIADAHCLPQRC